MYTFVREIQKKIKEAPKKPLNGFNPIRYMGTTHQFLGMTNDAKKAIAKEFHTSHPKISFEELITTLNELYEGISFEEKTIGPFILDRYKEYKSNITPQHLEQWLAHVEGWCEIDTLCQTRFEGKEILERWDIWPPALRNFSKHRNITMRRASLVLLCRPLRTSNDPRLYDLAIETIERLKKEKDVLITKAISWVLRIMTKYFKTRVAEYIEKEQKTLPAIAIRETRKKLLTGKK